MSGSPPPPTIIPSFSVGPSPSSSNFIGNGASGNIPISSSSSHRRPALTKPWNQPKSRSSHHHNQQQQQTNRQRQNSISTPTSAAASASAFDLNGGDGSTIGNSAGNQNGLDNSNPNSGSLNSAWPNNNNNNNNSIANNAALQPPGFGTAAPASSNWLSNSPSRPGFFSNDYYDPSGLYSPAYSRRWSTYGTGLGAGSAGGLYGTAGSGYYGSSYPYSHSWAFDPSNPMNAYNSNNPNANNPMMNSAFSTMHTTIHTFGMLADMLDSSFQALMTAFRALLGVSHHFGQLQAFIGVGLFSLARRLLSFGAQSSNDPNNPNASAASPTAGATGAASSSMDLGEFQRFGSSKRKWVQLLKLALFILIGLGTLVSGKRFLSWMVAMAREQQDRKWAPVVERLQEFEGRLAKMEHSSRGSEFEFVNNNNNSQTETESEGEEFEESEI